MKTLKKWLSIDDQRVALQRLYLVITGGIFALSAIISLFDASLGRQILIFSGLGALIFVTNAIVWALSQALMMSFNQPKSNKKSSK